MDNARYLGTEHLARILNEVENQGDSARYKSNIR